MPCYRVNVGGTTALVRMSKRQKRCACGAVATRECDYKVPGKRSGTCDKGICDGCTFSPADNKDICQKHAPAVRAWMQRRRFA